MTWRSALRSALGVAWGRLTGIARTVVDHPVWLLVVGLATIVAAVAIFKASAGTEPTSTQATGSPKPSISTISAPPTETTPTASTPVKTTPTAAETTAATDAVECWTKVQQKVSCSELHRYESPLENPSDCGQAVVLRYFGGVPNVELSYAVPARLSDGRCVVDLRVDARDEHSSVLRSASASNWRRCVSSKPDQDERCSIAHFGEYVPLPVDSKSPDPDNCESAASTYMAKDFQELSADFTVTPLGSYSADGAEARCLIRPRNSRAQLGDSLYELGDAAVPWVQ